MSMFRTGNPTLKETTFVGAATRAEGVMTLQGTVNKTGIALLILVLSAGARVSETRAVRQSARMTAGGQPLPSVPGSHPITSAFRRPGKCFVAPTPRSV